MEFSSTFFNIPLVFKQHHLHPMLVHFPIGLYFLATIFFLFARVKKNKNAELLGVANLIAATLFCYGALYSGLIAEKTAGHSDQIHHLLELHEKLGYGLAGLFTLLSLWAFVSLRRPGSQVIPAFIMLLLLGAGTLGFQGYLGAYMVYEGGVGTPMMRGTAPATPAQPAEKDDSHQH